MSDSTDLRLLFAEYACGDISAEQFQALEAALREDSNLRREFIEYMNIDSALGDMAALSEAEVADIESESTALVTGNTASIAITDIPLGRTYRVAAIVGTVVATLLFAAILWVAKPGSDKSAPVATLVKNVDAVLLHGGHPWKGTELQVGEYRLDRGLLGLRFDGGVMVYVEAPARFDALSGKRMVLHSGRLSATVPPEGIGFAVETPEAEVIDFGTEFSVDVESGTSEVHVFDGRVRVHPRSGKNDAAIDVRASQAVRITDISPKPVEIELATDRFIRSFKEPKMNYPHAVRQMAPLAYYRMPIRGRGLHCEPREYSGEVLTGDGSRPPHAPGFTGGSLRVRANSVGRGGRVDNPPPLRTGQFTLAVFVYLQTRSQNGTVATNIQGDSGCIALSLDANGLFEATVRTVDGQLHSVTGNTLLPLKTWHHVVVTADGEQLRIYESGQLVASTPCSPIAADHSKPLWIGTDAEGIRLWNGRIDELALFDKPLGDEQIAGLHQAAQEQMARSK